MLVKNPTDAQVGPYQFKDDTYGPIPAKGQISGVPDSVASWMRDSIHNFLMVLPEPRVVVAPVIEEKQEVKSEEKTEAPKTEKSEKPKTK